MVLSMMAELERDFISERTKDWLNCIFLRTKAIGSIFTV